MFKVPDHQVAGHQALNGMLGPLIDNSGNFYKPLQSGGRGTKEDIVSCYLKPTLMDIKIGSRTWYPQASEDYIQKCLKRDTESSSLPLGFRICGFQIYQTEVSGYWKPDRKSIQKLTADEVKLVLRNFVSSNSAENSDTEPDCSFAPNVYGGGSGILALLLELKKWFEEQTFFHFYSCSVLMVYEKESLLEGKSPCPAVKLVDFAHVVDGEGVIDHNFLGGLCSLINFISDIVSA